MKIAVYSRKSKFTGKGESIANQVELCRQYAALHYPDVSEQDLLIYEDEGFSGGNTDRPQFRQMMEDARNRRFSVLICYRLDRISRNIGDFAGLIKELNALSVSFVSIREQFDTNSPIGRAMMYIASVFSQLERETTAERIRDNMQELAKTGRWLGGMTPTGYGSRPVEKAAADGRMRRAYELVAVPAELETVRLIYRRFLETQSLTQVETFLLQNKILSKTGKDYTRFTVKNILENPVYVVADQDAWRYFSDFGVELCAERQDFDGRYGVMAYNKTLQQHGKSNRIREKANWIVAVGKHRGVIRGKDWVRVQRILSRNRSKAYRRPGSGCALLSGLLRCGNCGRFMRPKLTKRKNAGGERIYTYLCELKEKSRGQNCAMRNANGNELDRAVCSEIGRLAEDGSAFFHRLKASGPVPAGFGEPATELDRLQEAVRKNEKRISNLVAALEEAQDGAAGEYITGEIARLHDENTRCAAKMQELRDLTEAHFLSDEQARAAKNSLCSFSSSFDAMSPGEKRETLRSLIDAVVWDGEDADLYLHGAALPQREDSK